MSDQAASDAVRVLVVDDAGIVRLYYRQALEASGYVVAEALNGIEALEKLATDEFDLVVVDVNMPKMDGLSFLRTLRRRSEPFAATPALMTSTEGSEAAIAAAREAGANFYLVKPVAQEMLTAHVAALTGRPA